MNLNRLLLLVLITLTVFISCQKERSFENSSEPAKGTLQSDITSECLPKTISGTYVAGKNLNDSNFIEVNVNVSSKGSFTIATDTINGYSFKSSGVFTDTGMNKIKLNGTGTPTAAGNNLFAIRFDTTTCLIQIPVLPQGAGGPASFTLQGAGGSCLNFSTAGSYVKGVALTSSETVSISVNVTAIGTYNITTTAVNGMTFSGTGAFTTMGVQNITLKGSGTPTAEGTFPVPVTAGATACSFNVVVTAVPVIAADHFPLSANSKWSYDDPGQMFVSTNDTLTRLNINPATIAGNAYQIFQEQQAVTPIDSSFYRKSGNDYFEYTFADVYTAVFTFDQAVVGDINFLKENLTTGQTWQSAEFSGTVKNVPSKLKYVYTCADASATKTVNGKSFSNVYVVTWKPQISTAGSPYQDEFVNFETWFAKGVGIIYFKATVPSQSITAELKIRNWNVF